MPAFIDDFMDFLKEYKIVGLAIAVIIGAATKDLVNAAVDDVIMPIVSLLLPGEAWREATWTVATVEFQLGHLIGAVLDFVIIAFIVYAFARYILKHENVEKL